MDLLKKLNIEESNFGACIGGVEWLNTKGGFKNISYMKLSYNNYKIVIKL